jgi:hypothetical protein
MDRTVSTITPEDWPDIEGALRNYLRDSLDLAKTDVGSRVFFGVPRDSRNSFPCIALSRIGGGQALGDAPLDNALIQFDVYGLKADDGGGRNAVTVVALALRKALSTIRGRTRLDDSVVAWDPRVSTQVYSPMPADDRPRIILTVTVPCMYSPGVYTPA